jgi:hypothetical protein
MKIEQLMIDYNYQCHDITSVSPYLQIIINYFLTSTLMCC